MWDLTLIGIRAVTALLLGCFLSGWLLSSILLRPIAPAAWIGMRMAAAFLVSLVVMFHLVFWSEIAGIALRPGTIGLELGLLMLALGGIYLWIRRRGPGNLAPTLAAARDEPETGSVRLVSAIILGLVWLIGCAMLLRTSLWPLAGPDTPVRWDFLATRMLKFQTLSFYPPVSAADFRRYFYVDGIPPLVSICYWWTYAWIGSHIPHATGVLVTAQFAAILAFGYALARRIHSRIAAILTIGILVSSATFTWAVAIGQETGLTALSLIATMYFLVEAHAQPDRSTRWRWMILAGIATGLGPLSREYAWAFLILGLIGGAWMRLGWAALGVYGPTTLAVAAPWYARNLIRTGNPLFNSRVGSFPVNEVHADIMDLYRQTIGISTWDSGQWQQMLLLLLKDGPLPWLVGLVAMIWLARRWGFISIAIAGVGALWLWSVGYTSGGPAYSMRVLSPAMVMLSVLSGVLLAGTLRRRGVFLACSGVVIVAACWGALTTFAHPVVLTPVTLGHLPDVVVSVPPPPMDWTAEVAALVPRRTTVLTDIPFVAAALERRGIPVVPVWSPEVAFLLDDSLAPARARLYLRQLGICHVVVQDQINLRYLLEHIRLYQEDSRNWRVLHSVPNTAWLMELPPPQL